MSCLCLWLLSRCSTGTANFDAWFCIFWIFEKLEIRITNNGFFSGSLLYWYPCVCVTRCKCLLLVYWCILSLCIWFVWCCWFLFICGWLVLLFCSFWGFCKTFLDYFLIFWVPLCQLLLLVFWHIFQFFLSFSVWFLFFLVLWSWYSTVQYSTVQYSTVQHSAVQYSSPLGCVEKFCDCQMWMVWSRIKTSTAPILTDCEYGLGTPLSWRRKRLLNDCANPNKGTPDFLGKFGIPSVLSFIWPLIFTEIINRIMIMSDNV